MGGFERECTDAELGGAMKGQGLYGMVGAVILLAGVCTEFSARMVTILKSVLGSRIFCRLRLKVFLEFTFLSCYAIIYMFTF